MNSIKLNDSIIVTLKDFSKERCHTVFAERYHFVFETENGDKFRMSHFEELEYPSEPLKSHQFLHRFEKEVDELENLIGNKFLCQFSISLGFKDENSLEKATHNYVYDVIGVSLSSRELQSGGII